MTLLERRLLGASVLFGLLTLTVITGRTLLAAPHMPAVTGNFYGVNEAYVSAGTEDWPQANNNWCAVAAIEAVANYTFQMQGGQSYFPFHAGSGQQQIAADMNSPVSVSEWGTPSYNGIGPGFASDISRDFGTDPRSIAWGVLYESAAGAPLHIHQPGYAFPRTASVPYTYHNVIYHDGLANSNLVVAGMARALTHFAQPILVTTAHGFHTVVVSGVYADRNPDAAFPATVNAVNVWDPGVGSSGGGYQSARLVTWSNFTFGTNANAWGSFYSSNSNFDPDPAVGIYTPNSQYPSHWIGFRVDIEPDTQKDLGVDYALDEDGNVMLRP
jgi:hypothetical protein